MKQATTELAGYLNNKTEYKTCNLFKISLAGGSVFYITDFDKDVIFENHTFQHDLFMVKRGQTSISGTPEVDTTNVSIYADKDHHDLINNVFLLEAIHKGILDTAYLTLWRAYFDVEIDTMQDETLRPYGALKLFMGRLELTSCTNICAKFTAKAETTGLHMLLPLRTYQAQTSYANDNGNVIEYSGDVTTCVIPLKPSSNVLYKVT